MPSKHRIESLEQLLERADIWRASADSCSAPRVLSTGFAELDRVCAGGWPLGELTELLAGERPLHSLQSFRLLVPVLRTLSRAEHDRGRIVLVDPPCIPYAPGLVAAGVEISRLLVLRSTHRVDRLWGMEQALRSRACHAVVAWCGPVALHRLRRLQLAAEAGNCLAVLLRPERCRRERSPAALRACVRPGQPRGLCMELIKRRGSSPRQLFLDAW